MNIIILNIIKHQTHQVQLKEYNTALCVVLSFVKATSGIQAIHKYKKSIIIFFQQ